ncbi:MAG: class I SAM-dependent rRNA methyltransferase [Pirellulales bacterium]|nr:class I SAM-dependent rRNA methyltransferase [Pirellulales bacterium]
MSLPRVVLKPGKSKPFYARHPWVLDSAVARIEGDPADGAAVDLFSEKEKFIARGIVNGRSRIRVRLYTWDPGEPLDDAFWRWRLERAVRLRQVLGYDDPQGAARLVFSEGDGLSGLIVDRYAEYLALRPTALAVAQRLPQWMPMLLELTGAQGAVLRCEPGIARTEGVDLADGPCAGRVPPETIEIRDHGLRYAVDLGGGQKTGFYLDQRENRAAAARYLRGRRVLDVFCYTGGFALTAAALGGAREVLGVDSSRQAVALAEQNARRNGLSGVRFQVGEAFEILEQLAGAGERFGAVIVDPPKFARSRRALPEALRAYHWLNRLALSVLEPDGILVTCSCSGHVSREDFFHVLVGVAQQTRRSVQILEQRGAAPDHPILSSCPESEYLKCFICRA